jgi:protein TonB
MFVRSKLLAEVQKNRTLSWALGISLALHAVLLSIHFKLPEMIGKTAEQALDVILVNSKSANRPVKAQAKAQANLDGGGNTDEERRVKTPLPVMPKQAKGNNVIAAKQRQVAMLEVQQQQMLTQLYGTRTITRTDQHSAPTSSERPVTSGVDLVNAALDMARLEGQIARNTEEYNKRPRRAIIGARVEEYRFAQYVEDWRQKIERIGNLNYPEAAKGKLYGNLLLTVVIRADGSLDRVELNRSSGQKVLDTAARRIVEMAAPFAAFPENIRRDTDTIEITRTWSFSVSDRLQTSD